MPNVKDLISDGPYGGQGGSAYDGTHNEQKVKHLDAWDCHYKASNNETYHVLGALEFGYADNYSTGRIGGKMNGMDYYKHSFDFEDGETIKSMNVYAGHGEGFCDGFDFHTSHGRDFSVGNTKNKGDPVTHLGNGEWAGATGRDGLHGADAVVDNMVLYFRK